MVSFGPCIKGKALLVGTCSPPLTGLRNSAVGSEQKASDADFCTNKRTFRCEFVFALLFYNRTKMNLVSRGLWEI